MADSGVQAVAVLTDTDRAAIDEYVRQKVKAGIDEYLRRRIKWLTATIATVGGIGGFAFFSLLWSGFDGRLQAAIENSVKDANSNSQLVQARQTALQSELNHLQNASQLIERTRAVTNQIAAVEKDVDAADKARTILKRTDLQVAANLASTLSSLGTADSQSILKRLDELQATIPTRIEVSRGPQLGYGNRNSFQNSCSDSGQVMIAGSLGTTNLDFAPLCGQLRLVR